MSSYEVRITAKKAKQFADGAKKAEESRDFAGAMKLYLEASEAYFLAGDMAEEEEEYYEALVYSGDGRECKEKSNEMKKYVQTQVAKPEEQQKPDLCM